MGGSVGKEKQNLRGPKNRKPKNSKPQPKPTEGGPAGGQTAGDAKMDEITARLENLNIKMAEQKAKKQETVAPSAMAESEAGNRR